MIKPHTHKYVFYEDVLAVWDGWKCFLGIFQTSFIKKNIPNHDCTFLIWKSVILSVLMFF